MNVAASPPAKKRAAGEGFDALKGWCKGWFNGWFRGWFCERIVDRWPAALFVAGLVGIAHAHSPWIERIDFAALERAARLLPARAAAPKAWVYTIDDDRFAEVYGARTPLDRCALENDLRLVQADLAAHDHRRGDEADGPAQRTRATSSGPPDLLVVDLDLSPIPVDPAAGPDQAARTLRCQEALERRLIEASTAGPGRTALRTVLMKPFDSDVDAASEAWMRRLVAASPGISFGDTRFPIQEDVAASYYCHAETIAAVAYRQTGRPTHACAGRRAEDPRCATPCDAEASEERSLIDPRRYWNDLVYRPFPTGVPPPPASSSDRSPTRSPGSTPDPSPGPSPGPSRAVEDVRAAFLGVALLADSHHTAMGTTYGVSIVAASFLTLFEPIDAENRLGSFVADVVVALLFGLLISHFWTRFFADRLSNDPARRATASLALLGLGLCGCLLAAAFTGVSSLLLGLGIWLSPLPVAIGMLIDGAVTGSVDAAIEAGHAAANGGGHDADRRADVGSDLDADGEAAGRSGHRSAGFRARLRTLFYGRIHDDLAAGRPVAAALHSVYLLTWIVVVAHGSGGWILLKEHVA